MGKTAISLDSHKRGTYPFWSINIVPGQRILVKSASHRRELMKIHGLQDAREFDNTSIKHKKEARELEVKKKRKEAVTGIYTDIKKGKIDTRPMRVAQRKAEYEMRNYGRVL